MRRIVSAVALLAAALAATPPARSADPARLEVAWITREPRLPPPNRQGAPVEEGWPEPGRTVQWVGHLFNRGAQPVAGVAYAWRIDGAVAESGTVDLPPGETTLWLPWRWTFDRHEIALAIAPAAASGDATTADDRVAVASDALSIGFTIERSIYDWMLQDGRPGFERWAQGQIDNWNAIMARAVFPTTPRGALDRFRLDRVLVIADGASLRNGDMDTDVWWTFWQGSDERFLHVGSSGPALGDETIVFHELLHQRGLIDLYAYRVVANDPAQTNGQINIVEDGKPVAGGPLMPALLQGSVGALFYRSPVDGLMGTQYRASANLTEHCAYGLNRVAGRRTPLWLDQWGNLINGYSNTVQPESYVWLLPRRTELLLQDESGAPLAGASVQVYADHGEQTYQKIYGPQADLAGSSDGQGVFVLPGTILDRLPPTTAPPKAQVIIVGVQTAAAHGYAFLPVYDLNLLAFRGGREAAQEVLKVKLQPR